MSKKNYFFSRKFLFELVDYFKKIFSNFLVSIFICKVTESWLPFFKLFLCGYQP